MYTDFWKVDKICLQKVKNDLASTFHAQCDFSNDILFPHPELTMILGFRLTIAFPLF